MRHSFMYSSGLRCTSALFRAAAAEASLNSEKRSSVSPVLVGKVARTVDGTSPVHTNRSPKVWDDVGLVAHLEPSSSSSSACFYSFTPPLSFPAVLVLHSPASKPDGLPHQWRFPESHPVCASHQHAVSIQCGENHIDSLTLLPLGAIVNNQSTLVPAKLKPFCFLLQSSLCLALRVDGDFYSSCLNHSNGVNLCLYKR